MSDELEFSITYDTFQKLSLLKERMGFAKKEWNEWFNALIATYTTQEPDKNDLEKIFEKMHYDINYEEWIKNFALNLNYIWKESSTSELDPTKSSREMKKTKSAIVIGAGPSIKKHNHLELLAKSGYRGTIICTDRMLIPALKKGITPDIFPNFHVVTIDGSYIIRKFYDDEIVDQYGNKINGIFSTITHPLTAERARQASIKMHWVHPLLDYGDGKKSFNHISALMVRATKHVNGLPAIQTGGNVGTSCWFITWKILKCFTIGLIGINHGWEEDDPWKEISKNINIQVINKDSPIFNKLFPKIYNPEFKCYCILDPIFQYYSTAFKEFIARSPSWVNTINATEGGCIFGERITCLTLEKFLQNYKN